MNAADGRIYQEVSMQPGVTFRQHATLEMFKARVMSSEPGVSSYKCLTMARRDVDLLIDLLNGKEIKP